MNSFISHYLGGAIAFGFLLIGLVFLKFWKRTRDPFFQAFALAFFLMGIGRVLEAALRIAQEDNPLVYLIRFFSFVIIIFAIMRKNLASKA